MKQFLLPVFLAGVSLALAKPPVAGELPRLAYNNPGLVTDLASGLWVSPLPMDYNGDGLLDLVLSCSDVPSNGVYFFENTGRMDAESRLPLFKPAVRLGDSMRNVQISEVRGQPVVTSQATVYPDFRRSVFAQPVKLPVEPEIVPGPGSIRAKQWRYVDYDGDNRTDLVVGIDYWGDYGWDSAWDESGKWKNGPLHGYTYILRNTGTEAQPVYAAPVQLQTTAGTPADVYGMPSPCFGDFRGTGKLDLICGEFLDGFTYFENVGTRENPRYAPGRKLTTGGEPLTIDLCMFTATAVDFNGDGRLDLIAGEEDGRIAFFENTGEVVDGVPQFLPRRHFRQIAQDVKFGALVTPYAFDWDGDGREDLVCGNSAGYIAVIRNLGGDPVRWSAPELLSAGGEIIREQAGPNGSIQGPAEAKWGYSVLTVADWDGDGLPDIMTNGIWGKIMWYKNVGTRTAPVLAAAQPVELAPGLTAPKPVWNWWSPQGRELATQWRTTPIMTDWNADGLMDLVMLDHEGYLALFERQRVNGQLTLSLGRRIFRGEGSGKYNNGSVALDDESGLLQLNTGPGGKSGRRKLSLADWDGDGHLDLLVNSKPNVNFFRGLGQDATGDYVFHHEGPLSTHLLAGHTTNPTTIDLHGTGRRDLIIGAEDGYLYFLPSPQTK